MVIFGHFLCSFSLNFDVISLSRFVTNETYIPTNGRVVTFGSDSNTNKSFLV